MVAGLVAKGGMVGNSGCGDGEIGAAQLANNTPKHSANPINEQILFSVTH
jgi:hypothetical protein